MLQSKETLDEIGEYTNLLSKYVEEGAFENLENIKYCIDVWLISYCHVSIQMIIHWQISVGRD